MQLLCFFFTCLEILGTLKDNPLPVITESLYSNYSTKEYLQGWDHLLVKPRSGNMAMFYAIILHTWINYLSIDTSSNLDEWINLHVNSINKMVSK